MIADDRELTAPTGDADRAVDVRDHVLAALDHVKPEERKGVLAAAASFARGEVKGIRLPGADPVFQLQAAPDLLMFVRREPGVPIEVLDIVRPATLRLFADAAIEG